MDALLTIDVGTTSWKVILFDGSGRILCESRRPAAIDRDSSDLPCYRHAILWESILSCISEINGSYGLDDVKAIAVTSMAESVIPIDTDGNELYDIIPWFDSRSMDEKELLKTELGEDAIFSITGLDPGPIFSLPKIMWMEKHNPGVYKKAAKWLQMTDYINFKMTGVTATDYSLASRTLAFDLNTNKWSKEILDAAHIQESVFPEIIKSGTVIGFTNNELKRATGLKTGIPVVMGGHDHPCATISYGNYDGKTIFNSSGTAEPYLYVSEKHASLPTVNIGQRQGRHPDPDRYILWGGIVSSGISVEWAVKRLALCQDWSWPAVEMGLNELFAMCADIPCGSGGVIFTPYLRGSGAPQWDARMKANFLGMNDSTTSRHMLRAVLEGLSYQADMLVKMHETLSSRTIDNIYCAGGGSRGSLWQQIKADVTGKKVITGEIDEATSQGAAILAGCGIGLFTDSDDGARRIFRQGQVYIPNKERHELYKPMLEIYNDLHNRLQDINHRLDHLQRKESQ